MMVQDAAADTPDPEAARARLGVPMAIIFALFSSAALAAGADHIPDKGQAGFRGCSGCENTGMGSETDFGKDAQRAEAKKPPKDTRLTEQEFDARKAHAKDQKLVKVIDDARESMLYVLRVKNKQGEMVSGHSGYVASGFVAADRCYAWTSAHVVTEKIIEGKYEDGSDR